MTEASLQEIADILGKVGSQRVFTARRTAKVENLDLEVKGIGELRFPISDSQALQLRHVGRPAPYGKGEKTLLDPRVRDTWKVPKSRVKIDQQRWNRTLLPMLDSLRTDLGLPDSYKLKAEFHAMLLYGPGQFFSPHQDSEKADAMIGTLAVILPSSYKGGSFVIEHQGERVTYRGSKDRLTFIAFYADCRHEVRPVTAGFRIVLTYNLILDGEPAAAGAGTAGVEPGPVEALAGGLREHFETPLPARRFGREKDAPLREPPNRLVYLLDHQYTERGLAWHRLKGKDVARAQALRAAAERAGCELVLALAEVHETWSCFEPGWDEPWSGRHRSWERHGDDWVEDDPATDDPDGYDLVDLVDWGIRLNRWVDPSGRKAIPIVTRIDDDEVCATTPSSALEPYASEYEGYMGNYGNTMDRWYRRAAIVVWPRERAFAVRAEASPAWALGELEKRIGSGRLAEARELAKSLLGFWGGAAKREEGSTFFDRALRVAEGLGSPALAASLLEPFHIEELTAHRAPLLVALVECYGEDWVQGRLAGWCESTGYPGWRQEELDWLAALPGLCEALRSSDESIGGQAARVLLREFWILLRGEIAGLVEVERPSQRQAWMAKLAEPILGVVYGSEITQADDLLDEIVAFLCAEDFEFMLPCLVQLLRAAAEAPTEVPRASAALDAIRSHCIGLLRARLEVPERTADDWSMALPTGCACELCERLEAFLSNADEKRLEWPLAKPGRKHVHRRLDAYELPVRHETRRSGRPFTLVLSKTKDLFERETRDRRSLQADLEWLLAAPQAADSK